MTSFPTKPYRYGTRRQIANTSDSSLVGAWGGKIIGGVVPDESGNGNDGVPSGGVGSSSTVVGDALLFREPACTALACGGANAFPLADLTVSIWFRSTGQIGTGILFDYFVSNNDSWSLSITAAGQLQIIDDIDNAGTTRYATSIVTGKLHHAVAVMDSLENLLYLDGELIGSGESSSDNWSSFAGLLSIGINKAGGTLCFDGLIGDTEIYNEAKDLAWVQAQYALGAPAVQFGTDWGVTESLANETTGYLGEGSSPFEIDSGTWKISTDTINGQLCKVIECAGAGGFHLPTSLLKGTPTEALFGTLRFWFVKTDAGITNFYMVDTTNLANDSGYRIRMTNAEAILLQVRTAGATGVTVIDSGNGVITAGQWHCLDLTLAYNGEFELFLDGVSLGTGTDTTYTEALQWVVDSDIGCNFAYSDIKGDYSIVKYQGVVAP